MRAGRAWLGTRQQRLRLRGIARAIFCAKGGNPAAQVMRVIAGVDADHDASVGVALVARILAHAVGHYTPRLRCSRHHRAARAHAKAVHAAAIAGVVHQLVIGRTQQEVTGVAAPAGAVNHTLRMLNAKAHGEGLGLHRHTTRVQHGKGVAGAVAQRHYHLARVDVAAVAAGQIQHLQAANLLCAVMGF